MENGSVDGSKNNALFAGISYLAIIIIGMFAFVYAIPQVVIAEDIPSTLSNLGNSESLFRFGIFCILIMNVVSIMAATFLYRLLRPIDKNMAALMLILLLVGAVASMINETNHAALLHISTSQILGDFSEGQVQFLASHYLKNWEFGTHIAVFFWGLWLFPLSILVFKLKTNVSTVVSITLVIAASGYALDASMKVLAPGIWVFAVSDYTFAGELLLTGWLLARGKLIEELVLQNATDNI